MNRVDKENCLALLRPNLVLEWDSEKNKPLTPFDVSCGSNKGAWWTCRNCGESWLASIVNRSKLTKPTGCPFCSSPPLRASCKNNLEIRFPIIAAQLHPTMNGDLVASKLLPFSNKKLWFVCENGHEYEMCLASKTKGGQGCPKCFKSTSSLQLRVFSELVFFFKDAVMENRSFGFEIDILLPSIGVGVEVDGSHWHFKKEFRDEEKNRLAKENGISLIRTREKPLDKIGELDIIHENFRTDGSSPFFGIVRGVFSSVSRILGKPDVYKLEKDFVNDGLYETLMANRGICRAEKSLSALYPEVSAMWSEDNVMTPDKVRAHSSRRFLWSCRNGHSFESPVSRMVEAFKRSSPFCGCSACARSKKN